MANKEILRNEILDAHRKRFATKAFDSTKKITVKDWGTIIESGRLSPSSFGYEPWKFLLVKNEQVKAGLKEIAWGAKNSLNGASHFLIVLARKNVTATSNHVRHMVEDVFGATYSETSASITNFDRFQKIDFALNNERNLFDWSSKQTYIALGNMMTTASVLGIDSCPIEGFNRSKVEKFLADNAVIDLDEFGVSYMAGFGYRAQDIPVKKRQKLAEVYSEVE